MTSAASRTCDPVFHVVARPQDVTFTKSQPDELQHLLDVLHGEIGVTGLAYWAASAPARYMRSSGRVPRLETCEGGVFFEASFLDSGCRPPSTPAHLRDGLPMLARACQQRGLNLRLMLATATLGRLAGHYPEFASQNAFHEVSRSSVCLLHPAVQDCIRGMVRGVTVPAAGAELVLHDFRVGWQEAFDSSIDWPVPLGVVERTLLATCFCPACQEGASEAGVDVEEARNRIQRILARTFSTGHSIGSSWEGLLSDQSELQGYVHWQADRLDDFLGQLVEHAGRDILVACDPDLFPQSNLDRARGVIIRLDSVDGIAAANVRYRSRRHEVSLPASCLLGAQAEPFVAAMSRLAEWNCGGVHIDGLCRLPESGFTVLKQAIRFARRSSGL